MEQIVNLISTVGVPTALCVIVLIQTNKKVESLEQAIINNTLVIKELLTKLNQDKK